jgi:hypothetical protein
MCVIHVGAIAARYFPALAATVNNSFSFKNKDF